MNQIRPITICVCQHQDKILVYEGYDFVKKQTFYRPLGGGIEFGETSKEAIRREMMEEINAEVTDLKYLCVLENIFVCNGKPGHEIVMVYDGRLVNPGLYEQAEISGLEANGNPLRVLWKRLDEFSPETPLYPDGLLDVLSSRE
jgi:ADP-ribose pyrophosphatase YjhB (NUDIX family)